MYRLAVWGSLFLITLGGVQALVNVTACGIPLDTPGEVYVLQNNVSSDGRCFYISEDDITLDLNGHTITYGNNPPYVSSCRVYDESLVSGYVCTYGIEIEGWYAKVLNGTIRQGGNLLSHSEPVKIGGNTANYPEIGYLNVYYYSNDSSAIEKYYGVGGHIHHNYIESTASHITDRHAMRAAIELMRNEGNALVHDNVIINAPQTGIRVRGAPLNAMDNPELQDNFTIYNNYIRQFARVTNGYGIAMNVWNSSAYNNTIVPVSGRGIHTTRPGNKIYNNFVNVTEDPNPEYTDVIAHGIKVEYGDFTDVFNNEVYSYAHPTDGASAALDLSGNAGSGIRVWNNSFVAYFPERSVNHNNFGAPVHIIGGSDSDSDILLWDNYFGGNHVGLFQGYNPAGGYTFINNTWELLPNPHSAQRFIIFWFGTSRNIYFINNSYIGFDPTNVFHRSTDNNYTYSWYFDVRATNNATPVDAQVTIDDAYGQVVDQPLGSDGHQQFVLKEFHKQGSSLTDYNDYMVQVSLGNETQQSVITMDHSQELSFLFNAGEVCVLRYNTDPCDTLTSGELGVAIDRWYSDDISISELLQHVRAWKTGNAN